MPFLPPSPSLRKIAATVLLVSAGSLAVWQAIRLFGHHEHRPAENVLLYDLERKVLDDYPPGTLPGSQRTAALAVFAKTSSHESPKPGMRLEDLEKAGLRAGWLYRLDEERKNGLYADPRSPDRWFRSGTPECRLQLNRWVAEAAAFSASGTPVPCNP